MTELEKKEYLLNLIDNLKDVTFAANPDNLNKCIASLIDIYDGVYRHKYSEISYKIQDVIINSQSEDLEAIGENLNVIISELEKRRAANPNDGHLKEAESGFRKFSDHINLEIGRYNFFKGQLLDQSPKISVDSTSNQSFSESIERKISKLSEDLNKIKPIATQAQSQLDKLDDKLESNKISSITTLTIFSAVILSFAGGITFEAGVFEGIDSASPYRLVFIVALTGFILFNTIFSLLYIVGKMAGKTISTKCKYMISDCNRHDDYKKCGDGYCHKECSTVTLICRILHKYSYVFAINIILLWTMFADFIQWIYREENYSLKILALQLIPFYLILLSIFINWIFKKVQVHRIKLHAKITIINSFLHPDEGKSSFHVLVANSLKAAFMNFVGTPQQDYVEQLLEGLKNTVVQTDKDFSAVLNKLDQIVAFRIVSDGYLYTYISNRTHSLNKKKWKILQQELRSYLSANNEKS